MKAGRSAGSESGREGDREAGRELGKAGIIVFTQISTRRLNY